MCVCVWIGGWGAFLEMLKKTGSSVSTTAIGTTFTFPKMKQVSRLSTHLTLDLEAAVTVTRDLDSFL
jgi:hypothetical protein